MHAQVACAEHRIGSWCCCCLHIKNRSDLSTTQCLRLSVLTYHLTRSIPVGLASKYRTISYSCKSWPDSLNTISSGVTHITHSIMHISVSLCTFDPPSYVSFFPPPSLAPDAGTHDLKLLSKSGVLVDVLLVFPCELLQATLEGCHHAGYVAKVLLRNSLADRLKRLRRQRDLGSSGFDQMLQACPTRLQEGPPTPGFQSTGRRLSSYNVNR